ncbi:MAG: bifunctional folylpolyglutamate synthase/dihydrofolate synthase [Roseburia sp.]|nr:bifunctional folylpolyglutamate synthase/dihydrofolate synthase [Roseburia sp.]
MEERTVEGYAEAVSFLENVPRFTKKNPLADTERFFRRYYAEEGLGKIIHVAGTNGKGSVCAFLQQVCIESGYHVGMFVSPHLITTRERIVIDGEPVSEEVFSEAFNRLEEQIIDYNGHGNVYRPCYFERLFFIGISIFIEAGVEVTILETGLGGRLDATNVIKSPALCVITEIGLDHMEYLGSSPEEIAGEKAGIIKPGVPVVFWDGRIETTVVLKRRAAECGSICHMVSNKDYKINEIRKKFIDFSVVSRYYDYGRLVAGSCAAYQAENAAIAIRACEALRDCGLERITGPLIQEGIRNMRWRGRMEEILPDVYIDGAHNEDGVEAFVRSVTGNCETDFDGKRCFLIFSAVKDKRYDNMIEKLCGLAPVTDFVITHIPGGRGADLAELEGQFRIHTDKRVQAFARIEDAIGFALDNRGEKGIIYIVGSLYLAGSVESLLGGKHDKF